MGKVRVKLIKRVGDKLGAKYPNLFSTDFAKNKIVLNQLKVTTKLRNKIAGYIAHTLRPKKIPTSLGEEKPLSEEDYNEGAGY